MVSTLDLSTNTLFPGTKALAIQDEGEIPVYDTHNGMFYIRGFYGTDVSVVNSSSNQDVANIPLPSTSVTPISTPTIAVDNKTGFLYATNEGDLNVSVINTNTNLVTRSINVMGGPLGIAFDWANGDLYTADQSSNTVSVISASLNRTITNISVGQRPSAIVYNSINNDVWVANWASSNVSVIDPATQHVVANPSVGKNPNALAIDTVNDYVDVLNSSTSWGAVTFLNGHSNLTLTSQRVGNSPESLTYDPNDNRLFVANSGSSNVSIIDQPTDTISSSWTVGSDPQYSSIAYDPVNHDVYVACYAGGSSGNITVLSGTTGRSVANVSTNDYPSAPGIAANGNAFIVNLGAVSQIPASNVTVLAEATNAPIASIPLDLTPSGVAYDPAEKSVYVVDNGGGGTYRVDAASNKVVNREVGGPVADPSLGKLAAAYDGRNGEIFVLDPGRTAVDVFSSSHTFIKAIPVGEYPSDLAFDNRSGYLFVSQGIASNVSIIDGATNTVLGATISFGSLLESDLTAIVYDSYNNTLYVANSSTAVGHVIPVNATTYAKGTPIVVGYLPLSMAVDTRNHTLFVANEGTGNISVINETTHRVATHFLFGGAYLLAYDNVSDAIYNANYDTDTLSAMDATTYAALSGSPLYLGSGGFYPEGIAFDPVNKDIYLSGSLGDALITVGTVPTYAVTFHESGLPGGTDWSVTLNSVPGSSTGSTIAFSEPSGSYPFSIGSVTGYTANVSNGNVVVSSGPKDVYIGFTAAVGSYAVTFVETGLPGSTLWNVTLNGVQNHSTTTTVGFVEPGGTTYPFAVGTVSGYLANNSSGNVRVVSSPVTVDIGFTPLHSTFPVTFFESGLPSLTTWSVTFNHTTNSSSSGSIGFRDANGTWPFTVGAVTGFVANVTSGNVAVDGVPKEVYIGFTAVRTYPVNFTESGLPSATQWTVTLGGTPKSSSTTTISFTEANGSYSFSVGAVTGYSASPNSGAADVAGAPVDQAIVFTLGSVAFSVTLTAQPSDITLGNSSTLTATTSGGTPPFAYVYSGLPAGCVTQNASSWKCTPTAAGNSTIQVTVTDAKGAQASATASLEVAHSSPTQASPSNNSSSGFGLEWVILGAVIAAVAVLVIVLLSRRRRAPSPTPAGGPAPPPPPETPPTS